MNRILFILYFVLTHIFLYSEKNLELADKPLIHSHSNKSFFFLENLFNVDTKEHISPMLYSSFFSKEESSQKALEMYPSGIPHFYFQAKLGSFNYLDEKPKFQYSSAQYTKTDTNIELPIVFVIPSYNNANWHSVNLDSILQQKYKNHRIIYINDCSTDETSQYVEEKIKKEGLDYRVVSFNCSAEEDIPTTTKRFVDLVNQEKHFFTLVNNSRKSGSLANLYRAINSCQDNEIIGIVDGDDWLLHSEVLQEINTLYLRRNIWLTHGRFLEYPHGGSSWSMAIPYEIVQYNAFRYYRLPSHFKTFYAWLFKKIKLEDLLYQGNFYRMTGDMAIMFPMIEMAAERHAFVDTINYVYNMANDLNDNKLNALFQRELDAHIRSLPFYQRIEEEILTQP